MLQSAPLDGMEIILALSKNLNLRIWSCQVGRGEKGGREGEGEKRREGSQGGGEREYRVYCIFFSCLSV